MKSVLYVKYTFVILRCVQYSFNHPKCIAAQQITLPECFRRLLSNSMDSH